MTKPIWSSGGSQWVPPFDWGDKTPIVSRFISFSNVLEEAGLGTANFLYLPLKWRLNGRTFRSEKLPSLFRYGLRRVLASPTRLPRGLRRADIVFGSSYVVSDRHQRRVAIHFPKGEVLVCEAGPEPRSFAEGIRDLIRDVLALGSSLRFASRVSAKLAETGADPVDCKVVARVAFVHALYCRVAREVLRRSAPKCVVLGNANRPFELSLWFEAKKRGIPVVLLPYAELNVRSKPERIFSLCRAEFDLALPFSPYSATQLRRLRSSTPIVVVGHPDVQSEATVTFGLPALTAAANCDIIYLGGSTLESYIAPILKDALGDWPGLRLRVRSHPKITQSAMNGLYQWLQPDQISNPNDSDIAEDIRRARVAVAVRSTAILTAMSLGVPVVLVTPDSVRETLKLSPLRDQNLRLLEATNSTELRDHIQRLLNDPVEHARVVDRQHLRLRELEYTNDYFLMVTTAVRELAGLSVVNDGHNNEHADLAAKNARARAS